MPRRPSQHRTLRAAFDATVRASEQLTEQDAALVASGRKIAAQIDKTVAFGEGQEITKALYLVPHLMNIYREMLATPKARHDAGLDQLPGPSKLASVRDHRQRSAPSKKRAG